MRQGGWANKYKAHIVAMALIGIWHGANWTFLVFGLYWGIVIALYLAMVERVSNARPGGFSDRLSGAALTLREYGSVALMFALVCIGWVFFRAESIGDAWHVLAHAVLRRGAARSPGAGGGGSADAVGI